MRLAHAVKWLRALRVIKTCKTSENRTEFIVYHIYQTQNEPLQTKNINTKKRTFISTAPSWTILQVSLIRLVQKGGALD